MWYYEVILNHLNKRGAFIPAEELFSYILQHGSSSAVYKSVFMYREEDIHNIIAKKTVADTHCPRFAYWIPVDIDKGDNSDERTLQTAQQTLQVLFESGLREENILIWYSGSGYHIDIHHDCFGVQPCIDYPYIIKQAIKKMLDSADLSIYTRSAVIRTPLSLNQKTNRYKIPLTVQELNTLKCNKIIELASSIDNLQPRLELLTSLMEEKEGDGELESYIVKEVPSIRALSVISEPQNIVSCIYKMWQAGPQDGTRNNVVLRLASHFRRSGLPSEVAKIAILAWNNKSLDETIVQEKIEYVYNKGYKFSCSDKIHQEFCSTHCQHFKHKDLDTILEYFTADDLHKQLKQRMEGDYANRIIHIDKMLGLPEELECKIYPGELVTVLGPTGMNKSTFVQDLILGFDMDNERIMEEFQQPTLYFASELAGWLTHRRSLQIVGNVDKNEIAKPGIMDKIYAENKRFIDHIKLVTMPPTLDMIELSIKEAVAQVIVVDYIELIQVPNVKQDEKIPKIMQTLASLAVNKDIIIIMVSQISRQYSREGILDLYAGHGSSAIEKSSRKVFGINGKKDKPVRTLELLKNQDGDLWQVALEFQKSYRLRKIKTEE